MNNFQKRYDELSENLNSCNERLRELRGKFGSKEEELIELENFVFNKQIEVKDEMEIRDNMVDSKTKKLDKWTFNTSMLFVYLVTAILFYYVFKPYVIDGFLHKITNDFLNALALLGVSVDSLVSLGAIFFIVFGVSISIEDVIKKRMVSKIKKSKDYVKQNEKVLTLENELKEARQKKSSIMREYHNLNINISYEEKVCEGIKEKIEILKNEIVGTVIADKNTDNIEHKNKTKVKSKMNKK